MSRIVSWLKPPPKPESFTEEELEWARRVHLRILRIVAIEMWFVALAGTVVSYYLLDELFLAVPIVLVLAALAYTVFDVRLRRRVDEAVEERRAELRAFVKRTRGEPS